MDDFPTAWTALCAFAFLLGARHGFDADHLATIDGLARYNAVSHPRLAQSAGLLFSLGHGVVVVAVSVAAVTLAGRWQTPAWFDLVGVAISVAFLFGLAYVNVRAVLRAPPGAVVRPAGLKGRLLGRLLRVDRPWSVAGVGALFALSFDTISQAALIALAASRLGSMADAVFVAGLFVLGMIVVDGLNGAWICHLVTRANRRAAIASRCMALAVAAISAAVGLFAIAKVLLPAVETWSERQGLALGAAVIVGVAVAFSVGIAASRRHGAQPIPGGD
jgi:high-affinity nickel-transport protein